MWWEPRDIAIRYRDTIKENTLKHMPDSIYTKNKVSALEELAKILDCPPGPELEGRLAAMKELLELTEFARSLDAVPILREHGT